MPGKRKVRRRCSGSPRKSRLERGKSLLIHARKKVYGCGSRKRRQSRRSMKGGYNEAALQKVLDDALNATSGGGYSNSLRGSKLKT